MKQLNINIDTVKYSEEISEEAFAHIIKSGNWEEVTSDDLTKAMEAGGNVLVPQDLEGYTVVGRDGSKKKKLVKKVKKSPIADVGYGQVDKGITNLQELKTAIAGIGSSKDPALSKKIIKASAKSLRLTHLIPEAWDTPDPNDEVLRKSFEELNLLHKARVGLVKKQVMDKNGKVTTKWVKADVKSPFEMRKEHTEDKARLRKLYNKTSKPVESYGKEGGFANRHVMGSEVKDGKKWYHIRFGDDAAIDLMGEAQFNATVKPMGKFEYNQGKKPAKETVIPPHPDNIKDLYTRSSQHGAFGKVSYKQFESTLKEHGAQMAVGADNEDRLQEIAYPKAQEAFKLTPEGKALEKKFGVDTDAYHEEAMNATKFHDILTDENLKGARSLHHQYVSGYVPKGAKPVVINEKLIRGEYLSKNRFKTLLDRHPEAISNLGHMGDKYEDVDDYVTSVAFKRAENSDEGKKVIAEHNANPTKNMYLDEWMMETPAGNKILDTVKNEIHDRLYDGYINGHIKLKHDEKVINAHFDEHDIAH